MKTESFPSKIKNKLKISAITNHIQHCSEDSSQGNRESKGKKSIQIGKEEVILFFLQIMILYTEITNKFTHKHANVHVHIHTYRLLELVKEFCKVEGYKIKILQLIVFLYT